MAGAGRECLRFDLSLARRASCWGSCVSADVSLSLMSPTSLERLSLNRARWSQCPPAKSGSAAEEVTAREGAARAGSRETRRQRRYRLRNPILDSVTPWV